MAFDMDSDRCVGFKRRITEIGDTQETPPIPPPQSSTSLCIVHQDEQEEQDFAQNKNLSLLSDSKKSKSSSHCEESEIITEGNQELGFASGAQQSREVLGSLASGPSGNGDFVIKVEDFGGEVQKTENCEAGYVCDCEAKQEKFDIEKGGGEVQKTENCEAGYVCDCEAKQEKFDIEKGGGEVQKTENCEAGYVCDGDAKQEKFDIEKGGVEETAKESLLSASADKEEKAFVKSEVGVEVGSATEENKELGKEFESKILLEVKKKQLLEKLEVVLMAEDKTQGEKFTDFESSLEIEVIDQTALIDFNDKCAERKGNKNVNQEMDAKKARRSRRKAKKVFEMNRKNTLVRGETENGCRKIGDGTKTLYSRKEMEALRFTNIVEQRQIWKVIYNGLGAAVAREYDDLASSKHQKHIRLNFDPRQRFVKQEEAPPILSKYYYVFTLVVVDFWFIEFI
jgi:survival of motor neuron protein-interacting protein 1